MKTRTLLRIAATVGVLLPAWLGRADALSIDVGSATGRPGSTVTFEVTLRTTGQQVAGTDNYIAFDPATPIVGCEIVNSAISGLSKLTFEPAGCEEDPEVECVSARALLLTAPPRAIRGGVLYRCQVEISTDIQELTSFPLECFDVAASDPDGHAFDGTGRCAANDEIECTEDADCGGAGACENILPQVECTDGEIVADPSLPTPTPTPTPGGGGGGGGGGCAIAPGAEGESARWLMIPVAVLWWTRHRLRQRF